MNISLRPAARRARTALVTTGNKGLGTALHPVTAQTYTNTQALTLARNEG